MKSQQLRRLQKMLFKSSKEEWTSREAWGRRAVSWKVLAMALYHDNKNIDPMMREQYELFLRADQARAPSEEELDRVCPALEHYMISKQEHTEVGVSKKEK